MCITMEGLLRKGLLSRPARVAVAVVTGTATALGVGDASLLNVYLFSFCTYLTSYKSVSTDTPIFGFCRNDDVLIQCPC